MIMIEAIRNAAFPQALHSIGFRCPMPVLFYMKECCVEISWMIMHFKQLENKRDLSSCNLSWVA